MKANFSTIYRVPEKLTEQYAHQFLSIIESIFSLEGEKKAGVFFDVQNTSHVNILGQLLIYKFLDYTVKKECFSDPKTNLKFNKYLAGELSRNGFKKLVEACFNSDDPEIEDVKYRIEGACFIAPMVLSRNPKVKGVGQWNITKINKYYSYDEYVAFAILQCIGEISSNFQEHAVEDTKSVIVAKGDKMHFEIACADNGNGIISNLNTQFGSSYSRSKYQLLLKAIEKGVSSKSEDGHMGCGLWLVSQFVAESKGYMCIYSQGGYLQSKKGVFKSGACPYWKGTFIYLDIPLSDPKVFAKVINSVDNNQIKLNII